MIQAAAIGEFTSLDGIEWRSLSERALDNLEFEQEYSISLNDKNGRDAALSILTTVREENNAQLAFAPYYYFTSSIYEGECTDSQVALMTAKNSDTSLYLTKINGRQIYELVNKYLICRKDSSHQHRKII